ESHSGHGMGLIVKAFQLESLPLFTYNTQPILTACRPLRRGLPGNSVFYFRFGFFPPLSARQYRRGCLTVKRQGDKRARRLPKTSCRTLRTWHCAQASEFRPCLGAG